MCLRPLSWRQCLRHYVMLAAVLLPPHNEFVILDTRTGVMSRQILYFNEDPRPRDYIDSLSVSETAHIDHKLRSMSETEPHLWSHKWVEQVDGRLWRLRHGDHRLFYCLDLESIVILHAVRKRGRRLNPRDVEFARVRMERYYGS